MKLATKLVLTLAAFALPLSVVFVWWHDRNEWNGSVERLVEYSRLRMENGGRDRCENEPATFQEPPLEFFAGRRGNRRGPPGMPPELREILQLPPDGAGRHDVGEDDRPRGGPPPGARPDGRANALIPVRFELFAYWPDYHSSNPRAPPFPADLRAQLEAGAEVTARAIELDRHALEVATRMTWNEGPAAIVLARRIESGAQQLDSDWILTLGLLCGSFLAIVWFATMPIVRRVRRLTASVKRSAAGQYTEPVRVDGSDEIALLARAFDDAGRDVREHVERLEERESTLRAFVENTTHDVMLPLTVLQGHLSTMRKRVEAREAVDSALVSASLEESHYLASLLQNLALAAKLETGAPAPVMHPVVLGELVARVVARHAPIARERGVTLEHGVPEEAVTVQGDVTMIEQAVSNVVLNAVRYNERGGHVAIVLQYEGEARERFRLRVLDDGRSLSDADLENLTQRHWRSDGARQRHPDGRGLGLAITRDVAAHHGFELALARSEFGGLLVTLSGATAPAT